MNKNYVLPDDLIILISGVPGVGKTTISYELLKIYNEIRLVEETDIIREILRGYNENLKENGTFYFDNIYPHNIFLNYDMAKQQCEIMKNSIINIIKRQQRKKVPSIINGVHIIPEVLCKYLFSPNIIYINLYVDSEQVLWDRLKNRDPQKYTSGCVPYLYQTNVELNYRFLQMSKGFNMLYSINVSYFSVKDTLAKINCIFDRIYGS